MKLLISNHFWLRKAALSYGVTDSRNFAWFFIHWNDLTVFQSWDWQSLNFKDPVRWKSLFLFWVMHFVPFLLYSAQWMFISLPLLRWCSWDSSGSIRRVPCCPTPRDNLGGGIERHCRLFLTRWWRFLNATLSCRCVHCSSYKKFFQFSYSRNKYGCGFVYIWGCFRHGV